MISLGTQTDLNFELILNFISIDLPRLVSYDLVPMLLKLMTDPGKDTGDNLHKSLRMKVEELVRDIVEKSLPKSQTIDLKIKDIYTPVSKRRRTDTPGKAVTKQPGAVTLVNQPKCEVCGEVFPKYPDVVKHLLTHKESAGKPLNCAFCKFSSCEPSALAGHMKNTHLVMPGKRAPAPQRCKICLQTFHSYAALAKHKKQFHRGSDIPKCPKCNVLFEFHSQLVTHVKFSATCGGDPKATDPDANRYVKLPPARAAHTIPAAHALPAARAVPTSSAQQSAPDGGAPTVTLNVVPSQGINAANMVGNALLSALNVEPTTASSASTANFSSATFPQNNQQVLSAEVITENWVMDPTTGKPLPVSQFVEKRQAELAVRGDTLSKMVPNNNKPVYKCSVCNRSFTSKSMLVHHNEKEHLRKKTLSCTKCHLLFATFNELDSHFHRIHRKKTSSSGAETTAAADKTSLAGAETTAAADKTSLAGAETTAAADKTSLAGAETTAVDKTGTSSSENKAEGKVDSGKCEDKTEAIKDVQQMDATPSKINDSKVTTKQQKADSKNNEKLAEEENIKLPDQEFLKCDLKQDDVKLQPNKHLVQTTSKRGRKSR